MKDISLSAGSSCATTDGQRSFYMLGGGYTEGSVSSLQIYDTILNTWTIPASEIPDGGGKGCTAGFYNGNIYYSFV